MPASSVQTISCLRQPSASRHSTAQLHCHHQVREPNPTTFLPLCIGYTSACHPSQITGARICLPGWCTGAVGAGSLGAGLPAGTSSAGTWAAWLSCRTRVEARVPLLCSRAREHWATVVSCTQRWAAAWQAAGLCSADPSRAGWHCS